MLFNPLPTKDIYTDEIPGFFLLLKIISSLRAVKILFLSFTSEDIGVAMEFFSSTLEFWLFGTEKYISIIVFISLLQLYIRFSWHFCDRHFAIGDHFNCTILLFRKWIKKSCVLCRNFISIYKINRTLHGCLGTRILSSHAERISHSFALLTRKRYFQHSKIKFVFRRSHVISSMSRVRSLKDQGRMYTSSDKWYHQQPGHSSCVE